MTFCTRCGKQIENGQVCGCSAEKKNMVFCTRCGKQIEAGEVCGCYTNATVKTAAGQPQLINRAEAWRFMESMKNRMGIGEPERNATDCYERGQRIVPDSIKPNEGEIPIRQYDIAVLRNLLKFERAEGRMQITNKRVIFRAPGRAIGGRTILQHEYAVDEIAGIEAMRNFWFSPLHFLGGLIVLFLTTHIGLYLTYIAADPDSTAGVTVLGVLLWIGGLAHFFMVRKKFLGKLMLLGLSLGGILSVSAVSAGFGIGRGWSDSDTLLAIGLSNIDHFNPVVVLLFFTIIIAIFGWFLHFMRPNLVVKIKNKMGMGEGPIDISRGMQVFFFKKGGTPFMEVMPTNESERAIREIGAIISDIQKLGDFGINKWIEK